MAYRRRSSSWSPWPTKTTASEKAAVANKHAKDVAKSGVKLQPVILVGRQIAASFWGKSWCDAMESYGDYENRLPRGRTYVRNGSVTDLRVEPGIVRATVVGSRVYTTTITVLPLSPTVWRSVVDRHAGQVSSLIDLLQGKLPASLLLALGDRSNGLFPGPKELTFACSCPDWATMCKHVAAVLYGVGARLDTDPALFFLLRGVDVAELTARGASVTFADAGEDELGGMDLGAVFGIEMAEGVSGAAVPARAGATKAAGRETGAATKANATKPAVALTKVATAASAAKVGALKRGRILAATTTKPEKVGVAPRATAVAMKRAKSTTKALTAPKPTMVYVAGDTITDSELTQIGVDPATLHRWLMASLLLLGERVGEYGVTTAGAELLETVGS